MVYNITLSSSELEVVRFVLKHDYEVVADMLCENMMSRDKFPKDFEDYLDYRAYQVDKILDKIEKQIA